MNGSYQDGNTIRFEVVFKDWDELEVDPDIVKFIIYDQRFVKKDEFSVGNGFRTSEGSYYYDYTPEAAGTYYYEWYGEINGLPSLRRGKFDVRKL